MVELGGRDFEEKEGNEGEGSEVCSRGMERSNDLLEDLDGKSGERGRDDWANLRCSHDLVSLLDDERRKEEGGEGEGRVSQREEEEEEAIRSSGRREEN